MKLSDNRGIDKPYIGIRDLKLVSAVVAYFNNMEAYKIMKWE